MDKFVRYTELQALAFPLLVVMSIIFADSVKAQFFAEDNMNSMLHGPFVSTTYTIDPLSPRGIAAHKAIVVKVASEPDAVMAFDTDLLRVSSAWTGGFLHWYPARDGLQEWPGQAGFTHFSNGQRPGWTTGNFNDPRPWRYGPLPENLGRYNGLYLHSEKVVFSYTVGSSDILEAPGYVRANNHPVFTRTFNLGPTDEPLSLHLFQAPEGKAVTLERNMQSDSTGYLTLRSGDEMRLVGFQGIPDGVEWKIAHGHLILTLPESNQPLHFELAIGPVLSASESSYMYAYLDQASGPADLSELQQPGPALWEALETESVTGSEESAFAVDELTPPVDNPWNSHLRFTDVDFLSDGRAVLASLSGDVWLVDGIDDKRGTLQWKRFATGLNQPLGVKVVEDQIYITGRDQITVLHDRNGNGEADFYENFNNQVMAAANFHAFTMNLETDSRGNFYFAKATPWPPEIQGVPAEITPHHGVLFRLSPDGKNLEIIATGLRNPNGLEIGPDDEIIYADNEGNWIPTSFVQRIREGGFHGFVPSAQMTKTPSGEDFEKPVVWVPHHVDNSPAKPVFIQNDQWPAELQGHLLLASYGRGTLSLVLKEEIDGVWQGGLINLPLEFRSGLERMRFHEDGHLYIAGLTSWQSAGHGGDWGSFHRVRYTGKPLYLPLALNTKAGELQLQFSDELDPGSATDLRNYNIEQWTYPWTSQYGSYGLLYSVNNPGETGADHVEIESVQLSDDRKTVFLAIPGLQQEMVRTSIPILENLPDQIEASLGIVMSIDYKLRMADGAVLDQVIYKTIHRLPSGAVESDNQ